MKGNYFKLPRLPNSAVCFAFAQFQKTNLDEARVWDLEYFCVD